MNRSLRVLTVADVSPVAEAGGAERMLWEQASRLARLGHEVRILSRAPAPGAAGWLDRQGVRIRHFPVERRSPLRFLRSAITGARRAADRALAEAASDVLHLHQPLSGYAVLSSPAGRRIPSLYTFHSPAPLEYRWRVGMTGHHRAGVAGAVGAALLWLLEGACLRRATRVHVLSDFSARLLWRLYRVPSDRVVRIPGSVDPERFRPAADPDGVRKALGLPAAVSILLSVRNLEPRMGLDRLLRALAILRRHVPDVLLLIGGTGSLRNELESLAASLGLGEHVRFLGFVPEGELPLYYQTADAFVLPTRALEGFGLVTVEALACGTPVLGTPVGATPEILRPLDSGLMFRDTTPEAIARGLREFLDARRRDPVAYEALREACRGHAKARYGWDDAVTRLEETLEQLAGRRPGPPDPVSNCPACGDPIRARDLCYLGTPYLRCTRCGTRVVAARPTEAVLRRHYETEYPNRHGHEAVDAPRGSVFTALLGRLEQRRPPGRLLDVGCGGGHLPQEAARHGWRAVGSDLSSQACRRARGSRALPVVQAESAAIPVGDGRLDAVTFVNVLDHVLDPLGALGEAHRVLAPGGHLVIRVPNAAFHRPWVRLLAALGPVARYYGWDGYPVLHLYAFGPGGLRRLVERAGFRVVDVRNSVPSGQAPECPRDGLRRIVAVVCRKLTAVTAGAAVVVSGGWCLWAPSIELYAEKPGGGDGLGHRPPVQASVETAGP